MAGQNENTERDPQSQNSITLGFSLLAGLGVTLMMVGAAWGVIEGESADSTTIGLLIIAGALMFISGAGVWMGYTRPWETFDDISQPMYHGHHHEEEEHAVVLVDEAADQVVVVVEDPHAS